MPKKITKFEVDTIVNYARKQFRDAILSTNSKKEQSNKKAIALLRKREDELYKKISELNKKKAQLETVSRDDVYEKEREIEQEVRMQMIFADDLEGVKKSVLSIVEQYVKEMSNA